MESGIHSSFIPHDAAVPQQAPRIQRQSSGLSELILLASIVLLVASGALAGAVFLYSQYATSAAKSKLQQLQVAEQAFEPALIQEITRLDDRMTAGAQILSSHIAPTALFDALQQTTLATVSFQTLDFEAPDPQHMTLKMSGVAEGVNSIALEADLLSKSGVITSPIFSNISRQLDGVHFSLSALVNPASLGYARLLSASQPQDQGGAAQSAGAAQSIFGTQGNPPSQQQQASPSDGSQAGQTADQSGQMAPQLPASQ